MKKTKISLVSFTIVVLMLLSSFEKYDVNALCDAPLVGGHTGAPGETSCTGCHAGTNNTGPGTIIFNVGGGATQYVPGQIYTCTVSVSQSGIDKMGFACLALQDNQNTLTIGTFSLTEPLRTRLYVDGTRNYVSHKPCGADASTVGYNQWTFTWQAPSTNVGSITLYVGALATNHNHATTGDFPYTRTVQLTPAASGINATQEHTINELRIFPNPANNDLQINYVNSADGKVSISLFNLQGSLIKVLLSEKQSIGKQTHRFELEKYNVSKGTYFIKIESNGGIVTRKIAIL